MAETKAAYTHVGPGLPPLYGARAKALILGSFPSPKSREQGFFYGHPQNRFCPLMASLTASTGMPAVVLPSTSPANAAWSMDRLRTVWGRELLPFLQENGCERTDFVL